MMQLQQQQFQQPGPQLRQRPIKARLQTTSVNGRSSSNSRKSDVRDLDPMTRSENYK